MRTKARKISAEWDKQLLTKNQMTNDIANILKTLKTCISNHSPFISFSINTHSQLTPLHLYPITCNSVHLFYLYKYQIIITPINNYVTPIVEHPNQPNTIVILIPPCLNIIVRATKEVSNRTAFNSNFKNWS